MFRRRVWRICGFFGLTGMVISESLTGAWYDTYSSVLSLPQGTAFETVAPRVIRLGGYHGGWYGFWYHDDQEYTGYAPGMWSRIGRAGIRRMIYLDGGQVGDYVGFFDASGRMVRNNWSLPFWTGFPPIKTARWFGLEGFMEDADWAPYPTAQDYALPGFTYPDGSSIEPGGLYNVICKRSYDDTISTQLDTAQNIDDVLAQQAKLDQISERVNGRWVTTRLKVVDYANPQMSVYRAMEAVKLIGEHAPDGLHIDELGELNLWAPWSFSFGLWSVYRFREYLADRFTSHELAQMGVADVASFDIGRYARTAHGSMHPKWTEDRVWNEFKMFKVLSGREFWKGIASAVREKASEMGLDLLVAGNLIPVWPGAGLNMGLADLATFEWRAENIYPQFSEMGLPPRGRVAYVARLAEKLSNAPYSWINLYVSFAHAGLPELHKIMAFDTFCSRAILDYNYSYGGMTYPGTDASAAFINRVIDAVADHGLSSRRYVADIALVFNPWCDVAETTVQGIQAREFLEEYSGWCDFLVHTHRQWDVLHSETMTAQRLAEFPLIVLPSVVVLTDGQVAMLKEYVSGGGHLIITGKTGKRHGSEGSLLSRAVNAFEGYGAVRCHSTKQYPGRTYRMNNRDADAAAQMENLLDFPDFTPSLLTDASIDTGVNLNRHEDDGRTVLSIDLNNYSYSLANDTVTDAPDAWITINLPPDLKSRAFRVHYLFAGMDDYSSCLPYPEERVVDLSSQGQLRIRAFPTRYFQTILVEFVGGPSRNGPVLANFSTRGRVGAGDEALVGGVVIEGVAPKRVLVRACGMALGDFGVAGVLDDPVLSLNKVDGTPVARNTNWSDAANAADIVAATLAVGAFPFASGSTDSAILITLDPGAYTAVVTGNAGATGTALVEVYDVGSPSGEVPEMARN